MAPTSTAPGIIHPSGWLTRVESSPTVALSALAMSMKRKGIDVINLAAGEPDFDTPTAIREAAKQAIDAGHTHYTPAAGLPELREGVARMLTARTGLEFGSEHVAITSGTKLAVYASLAALLEPGDEVLVPAPYWVSYPAMVEMLAGVPKRVWAGPEQGFKVTATDLERARTTRTRGLIFNSPCNPTGADYSRAETEALALWAAEHDVWILADEIYAELRFTDSPYVSIARCDPRGKEGVVINDGFSKSYAMTGWRLGYVAAAAPLVTGIIRMLEQTTSNACSISQYAALAALAGGTADVVRMRDAFRARRDATLEALAQIPDLVLTRPDGAFYIFIDVQAYLSRSLPSGLPVGSAEQLCSYLLEKHHIALVPGEGFGAPGFIRLSYAADPEILKSAVARLRAGLVALV
jgi:aspartate aminotransferase